MKMKIQAEENPAYLIVPIKLADLITINGKTLELHKCPSCDKLLNIKFNGNLFTYFCDDCDLEIPLGPRKDPRS